MPTPTFQPPQGPMDTAQLQDWIVKLIRDLDYLLSNLDTLNVNRLDAKVVTTGILNAALVTVKAALTGLAYIQLSSAGMVINDGTKNTFTADINGLVTMVGALIQSAAGFPKVELNSANNLIAAYSDANNYIAIIPNYSAVPSVVMVDTGVTKAFMRRVAGSGLQIGTLGGEPINFQSGTGPLQINGTNGYSGSITYVKDVVAGAPSYGTISVTKGIITSVV